MTLASAACALLAPPAAAAQQFAVRSIAHEPLTLAAQAVFAAPSVVRVVRALAFAVAAPSATLASTFAAVAQQPWLAIAIFMAAFLLLIVTLAIYQRLASPNPESVRKLLHVVSGLLTLTFPFIFLDRWPVLLLTGSSAALIASMKWLRPIRARLGGVVGGDGRETLGEIYFPVAVAIIFSLVRAEQLPALLFCIPILVLTLADATGALIGIRYGLSRYVGAAKSLEGSVAFAIVAFFCIDVPLTLWSDLGRVETLLIASTLALLVMLLEGAAWRGLDNLFVPLGVFFVLRTWWTFDTHALLARFIVTILLVFIVVLLRTRSTLEDDALLAGAFLCYVTWALLGWRWLVPPAIAFAGYAWMSPRTDANSQRIHDVPAVLSVWAFAVYWLTLAHATGERGLLHPFTLVFAAHLAIFGASRMASDFPQRGIGRVVAEAIVKSWLMFFVPFVLIVGVSLASGILAVAAGVAIAAAVLLFARMEASRATLRNTSLDLSRWIRQAASAGVASVIGWVALRAIDRWAGGW
jgi:phytol kinase